jgi:phage gp29-like protein
VYQVAAEPEGPRDLWQQSAKVPDYLPDVERVLKRPASSTEPKRPQIAAVEVDPAGCSYNPDHEHHQDAIAAAVAAEVQKQLDKELEPKVRATGAQGGGTAPRELRAYRLVRAARAIADNAAGLNQHYMLLCCSFR